MATLLVQDGTLQGGDIILCGATYGRVRPMYNDLGRPIEEAGPSVPVRITGLDEVPNADDPFHVVDRPDDGPRDRRGPQDARTARRRSTGSAAVTLDSSRPPRASQDHRAEGHPQGRVRGSVEAIRKELEKLKHEEVRVRVLHAGIGAITESDVQLALTIAGGHAHRRLQRACPTTRR